jgi:hypothetical protein
LINQRKWVGWRAMAAPGNMLVGSRQHQRAFAYHFGRRRHIA